MSPFFDQSLSDIEIARRASLLPIDQIAEKLAVSPSDLERYGETKAKVSLNLLEQRQDQPNGKLILVSAITPTPAGEGKTTTSIGLTDGLNRIGKRATVCLREPSLGPCFGMKGGAAGGGYAQVVPMEEINLHFTGDFHAITTTHNLLAAMIDNHLHHGNALGFDSRTVLWRRVVDLNDRALRHIVVGLGGTANSIPCESGFDITTASEIMAILCLSESLQELKRRFGDILVGYTRDHRPIHAADLKAHGAMAALMKNAIKPNLVQTLEGNPAFVHGGPFANIAHGCNSVIATKMSMKLSEYTVTEAGFGADLGAEKFFDIKCRMSGIRPDAVVLVATVRALKMHGGVDSAHLKEPDLEALRIGLSNLRKHIENIRRFGLPVVVAINTFPTDTEAELAFLHKECAVLGVSAVRSTHWADGGAGAMELAQAVVHAAEEEKKDFRFIYPNEMSLWDKINTVCREIYGAAHAVCDKKVMQKLQEFEAEGFGNYPVCIAKTQYSFSIYPHQKGCPAGFEIPIRDVHVSAGARFVVVLAGEILTMPGLPKVPAAEMIDIDEAGNITGLF